MGCSSSKSTNVTEEMPTVNVAPSSSKPTLYIDPGAPTCRAVAMVCSFAKISVEVKMLALMKGEHKTAKMLELNPVGTLPFLVDGDLKLNDSQAMAVYLVNKYATGSKLYGTTAEEMAKIDELLVDAKFLYQTLRQVMGAVRFGAGQGPTDADRMKVTEIAQQIDGRLDNQLYNLGNYPTLADIFLYSNLSTFYYLTNWHVKSNNLEKWSKRLVEGADFKSVVEKLRSFAEQINQTNSQLYYNPLSPPSRACHMVACHLNVPIELKVLDLPKGEHKKPEYLAIQPAGTVPCLGVKQSKQFGVDKDFYIGDSNPIACYLANTFGKNSKVYGSNAEEKAKIDEQLTWEADFRVNMSKFFLSKAFGAPEPTEEQVQKLEKNLEELEARLGENSFTCGDNLTLADFFIAETLIQLEIGRGLKCQTSNIVKFMSVIESLPYFDFAHKGLQEMKTVMKL